MKNSRFTRLTMFVFILAATALVAHAQATRTWVASSASSADDANPCSRTAPCLTFAGAISKTKEGGEIDVIEPGAYGTVTINKAITIDGGTGAGWASVLAGAGATGITIDTISGNNADNAEVILRNLTLNGARQSGSAGAIGIDVVKVIQLHLENVEIENFSSAGININPSESIRVFMQHVTLDRDVTGVKSNAAATGFSNMFMDDVTMKGNANGLNAQARSFAAIRNSYFAGNTSSTNGAIKVTTGCTVNIENSMFAGNTIAVNVDAGGTANISNNSFYGNSTALMGAGTIATATNSNKFGANTTDGSTNATITVK